MNAPPPHKKRFPLSLALTAASEITARLHPYVTRLIIAGSIRREKDTVGDIEILYIPRITLQPDGLFDTIPVNLTDAVLTQLLTAGFIEKRTGPKGGASWGDRNKFAVHAWSGIPVDLFAANETNWFNYLVCRTGPHDSNIRIATAAQKKGWKWNPYGSGFSRGDEHIEMHSEEEVFAFAGLPCRHPRERT